MPHMPLASAFRLTHTGTSGSARRGARAPRGALPTLSTVEPPKEKAPYAKGKIKTPKTNEKQQQEKQHINKHDNTTETQQRSK